MENERRVVLRPLLLIVKIDGCDGLALNAGDPRGENRRTHGPVQDGHGTESAKAEAGLDSGTLRRLRDMGYVE